MYHQEKPSIINCVQNSFPSIIKKRRKSDIGKNENNNHIFQYIFIGRINDYLTYSDVPNGDRNLLFDLIIYFYSTADQIV